MKAEFFSSSEADGKSGAVEKAEGIHYVLRSPAHRGRADYMRLKIWRQKRAIAACLTNEPDALRSAQARHIIRLNEEGRRYLRTQLHYPNHYVHPPVGINWRRLEGSDYMLKKASKCEKREL